MDRVEMHSDYRKSKILEYVDWNDWKRKWNGEEKKWFILRKTMENCNCDLIYN